MFSENIDNDDYMHCTDPVEARIAQFNGNDTHENTEVTAIAKC